MKRVILICTYFKNRVKINDKKWKFFLNEKSKNQYTNGKNQIKNWTEINYNLKFSITFPNSAIFNLYIFHSEFNTLIKWIAQIYISQNIQLVVEIYTIIT